MIGDDKPVRTNPASWHLSLTAFAPAILAPLPSRAGEHPSLGSSRPRVVTGGPDLVYDDVALENQQIRQQLAPDFATLQTWPEIIGDPSGEQTGNVFCLVLEASRLVLGCDVSGRRIIPARLTSFLPYIWSRAVSPVLL